MTDRKLQFELNEELRLKMLKKAIGERRLAASQIEMILNLYSSYRAQANIPDAIAGAHATTDCLVKTGKIPPQVVVAVHRLLLVSNPAMFDHYYDALVEQLIQHNQHMAEQPADEERPE
jgi:hypothetical protein